MRPAPRHPVHEAGGLGRRAVVVDVYPRGPAHPYVVKRVAIVRLRGPVLAAQRLQGLEEDVDLVDLWVLAPASSLSRRRPA